MITDTDCQRLVLLYFSIVFSKIGTALLFYCIFKGFLFLQDWLKQFDCMNQLAIIAIMWFFHMHTLVPEACRMYQANNHGWRFIPRLHCPVHYCTIINVFKGPLLLWIRPNGTWRSLVTTYLPEPDLNMNLWKARKACYHKGKFSVILPSLHS